MDVGDARFGCFRAVDTLTGGYFLIVDMQLQTVNHIFLSPVELQPRVIVEPVAGVAGEMNLSLRLLAVMSVPVVIVQLVEPSGTSEVDL